MKHRVSLVLAAILFFGGVVMALFPMARYVGACVAAVGALVFLFPRVPVWLRWVLGVLTALALADAELPEDEQPASKAPPASAAPAIPVNLNKSRLVYVPFAMLFMKPLLSLRIRRVSSLSRLFSSKPARIVLDYSC